MMKWYMTILCLSCNPVEEHVYKENLFETFDRCIVAAQYVGRVLVAQDPKMLLGFTCSPTDLYPRNFDPYMNPEEYPER